MIDAARTDLDIARRVLVMFTAPCPSLASFNRGHHYPIGIPARFLPDRGELGQADLLVRRS